MQAQEEPLGKAGAGLESRPVGLLGEVRISLLMGVLLFTVLKYLLGIPLFGTDMAL